VGAIHFAHTAHPEERLHLIAAKPSAHDAAAVRLGSGWGRTSEEVDEATRGYGLVEEGLYLTLQRDIAGARPRQKPSVIAFHAFSRGVIQLLDSLPALRRHTVHSFGCGGPS
jgi:hypothetical protein